MSEWRRYHVTVDFRVPLAFAYRWCTDYTPDDGRYGGEDRTIHLQRRVLSRGDRRVVFENLYDVGRGWGWERHVVTLRPPDRWHCEGRGNYHESVLDYALTAEGAQRTRFDMRWRSRPIGLGTSVRPAVRAVEEHVRGLWRRRARALEAEFRRRRPSA